MTDEMGKILKKLEEGKISAAEGTELIRLLIDKKEPGEAKKLPYIQVNLLELKY